MKKKLLLSIFAVLSAAMLSMFGSFAAYRIDPCVGKPNDYLFPNPSDPGTFYSCLDGYEILLRCPDGLHFNPYTNVCDWPQNVRDERASYCLDWASSSCTMWIIIGGYAAEPSVTENRKKDYLW